MSTRLPLAPGLDLLSASLTQALQHALAFLQARPVHAQSASRACVWRTHANEPPRRTPVLAHTAEPRHALLALATTRQPALEPYNATARALLAARRRRPTALRRSAPPKPPRLATWPIE